MRVHKKSLMADKKTSKAVKKPFLESIIPKRFGIRSIRFWDVEKWQTLAEQKTYRRRHKRLDKRRIKNRRMAHSMAIAEDRRYNEAQERYEKKLRKLGRGLKSSSG